MLVTRHGDRLWAVALRTLGNREEAADAVQDAWLSAYRRADSYLGEAEVTTWLHRIVVNACLDRVRRTQVRPVGRLPEVGGTDEPVDPRDEVSAQETALDVRASLAQLPLDQRLAVVLVDVQDLPVAEAAAILDVPVGTVKSRCARGRGRLARLLSPAGETPVTPPGRNRPSTDHVEPAGPTSTEGTR